MKFGYSTRVRLSVRNIKPEELATVMDLASNDGYGPFVTKIYPDYEFDCEGYPMNKKGTYTIEFETAYHSSEIENAITDQFEQLKEIENSLIE